MKVTVPSDLVLCLLIFFLSSGTAVLQDRLEKNCVQNIQINNTKKIELKKINTNL